MEEIEVKRLRKKKEKVEESRSFKNVFVVHCDRDIMFLLNSIFLRVLEQKHLGMFFFSKINISISPISIEKYKHCTPTYMLLGH